MKILRVAFVIAVLCAPFYAQQVNQDIFPASPGLNLGHSNQRWNGYFNNLDVNNLTCNGVPCGGSGNGGGSLINPSFIGPITMDTPHCNQRGILYASNPSNLSTATLTSDCLFTYDPTTGTIHWPSPFQVTTTYPALAMTPPGVNLTRIGIDTDGIFKTCVGTGACAAPTGQATSIAFPTGAQTAPGTVNETNCSNVGNTVQWTQLADGTYAQQSAIDITTTMPNVSGPLGTIVHCRREWWNDTNSVPQNFKNAMVGFWHKNSIGVDTTTNDNRTVAIGLLLDNSYSAGANSTAEAWYNELDMTGAPRLGQDVILPLNESAEAIAGVIGDTRSGKTGGSNGPTIGVRGSNLFNGSFNTPYACTFCNFGTVGIAGNASSQALAVQGYFGVGLYGYCRGDIGGGTEQCYGVLAENANTSPLNNEADYGTIDHALSTNYFSQRYTDSSPTGLFIRLRANGSNTTLYSVDKSGNTLSNTYGTTANCAAIGTGANPSLAACGAAPAGSFSCATNASGGTCTVNTTAVTANSEIFLQQRSDTTTGTRIGVTCNTGVTTAIPDITAVSAGTSFTFNVGTVSVNPECFSYSIVN